MSNAMLLTQSGPFQKARSVNQTSASFVSKVSTTTEPVGDAGTATGAAVFDLCQNLDSGPVQNSLLVMPYATGNDNVTFSVRVLAWRRAGPNSADGTGVLPIWRPMLLVELLCTASLDVGVSGAYVLNSERFADTIALTTGNDDVSVDIVSPTGDVAGHALLDMKGARKIELTFSTGSSATACNALWCQL